MASTSGKKTTSKATSSGRSTSATRKKSAGSTSSKKRNTSTYQQAAKDSELFHEIGLIVLFAAMVILFLCNFGVIGPVGDAVSGVLFGIFGFEAYVTPVVIFIAVAFWFANEGSPTALRKMISGTVLFMMFGVVCDLISGGAAGLEEKYDIKQLYGVSSTMKNGGGCLAGSISYFLQKYLETIGTILVVILCAVISVILLTEKSLLKGMKEGSSRIRERSREDAEHRREMALARREAQQERQLRREEESLQREEIKIQKEDNRRQREEARRMREEEYLRQRDEARRQKQEERRLRAEVREDEKILRMDKKVSGVILNTTLTSTGNKQRDDIHEITLEDLEDVAYGRDKFENIKKEVTKPPVPEFDFDKIRIRSAQQMSVNDIEPIEDEQLNSVPKPTVERTGRKEQKSVVDLSEHDTSGIRVHSEATFGTSEAESADVNTRKRPTAKLPEGYDNNTNPQEAEIRKEMQVKVPKTYIFPPLSRLQKGTPATADSTRELKETALRLQQTLHTFGVNVTITDISQGPSVTRYELQPEQGVKVSKIVGLADDIKLNLAATDIRIEAPIPGKAAVGIEVPNKENTAVALRDLLETSLFKEFQSNLAFAVGKDIAGQVVVSDIAKMPHMLIAGATGSGKSVCINTLIMSILYKAHPDDVKLIMIDPKVVELSVYNGIPHLLIPVVTDPKKASAALHWGVAEMTDRYRKFADFNVRDLKGYNKKLETMREQGQEDVPAKMPQIVIIVDELADLMMVAPGEVEESICRLAQLARAAGIHLIIATQRPSVDVITGLIKANMPSRVAFSVSSGVDSRTILDMNGAEKLLGKGDMLFYPQGYSKPARIQGAFVSDKEVSDVVDFLKNQNIGNVYADEIEEQLKNIGSGGSGSSSSSAQADDRDEYFAEAGRFIIDKDKASIGMLQRVFKIGFNRAARIMDQLAEYGVVGEEEGTKPRKVLMSMEQFEQLLEEI